MRSSSFNEMLEITRTHHSSAEKMSFTRCLLRMFVAVSLVDKNVLKR